MKSALEIHIQKFKSTVISSLEQNFVLQIEKPKSTIGYKYPTLRDHPLRSPATWLEGKRADDGAENFWRVHDHLYDFTNFIPLHPGGADWLELTKGTDITEAFEAHHLSTIPETHLKNYFVRQAKEIRNSPFTFKDDGFYRTLKRRVKHELENVPKEPATRSKFFTDAFALGFLVTAVLTIKMQSIILGMISGTLLTMTCIASHNFSHQRDNLRMFYMGFAFLSYRDWRINHVLSHHLFPNTVYDLEISALEPFLQFLPSKKNFFTRYVSWFYSPIIYALLYFGYYLKGLGGIVIGKRKIRIEDYTPLLLFVFFFLITGQILTTALKFFIWIEIVSSFLFSAVALSAGHHHPDVFHDGDTSRSKNERDWGLHQVNAVMDRVEITGSHFLALISFGDHCLHHLFPTIDQGKLAYLYPVFETTCREFGVKFRITTQLECVKGQFQQLAKTTEESLQL